MGENTAKIIIDASADGVLRAAEQVKKKMVEVGEAAAKPGEKLAVGMLKAIVSGGALIGVLRGVADAYNQAAANAAKLSKETGGRQVSGEIAGQRLGLNAGQVSKMLTTSGSRSAEERSSFLSALADAKGPGGRKINAQDASEAFDVFMTGTADQGEILGTISKSGGAGLRKLGNAANLRKAKLSDQARGELSELQNEFDSKNTIATSTADQGARQRILDRNFDEDAAEHPIGRSLGIHSTDPLLKSLQEIKKLHQQGNENTRPRLNTSANGP